MHVEKKHFSTNLALYFLSRSWSFMLPSWIFFTVRLCPGYAQIFCHVTPLTNSHEKKKKKKKWNHQHYKTIKRELMEKAVPVLATLRTMTFSFVEWNVLLSLLLQFDDIYFIVASFIQKNYFVLKFLLARLFSLSRSRLESVPEGD